MPVQVRYNAHLFSNQTTKQPNYMSNKNNSPAQKAAWKANQKIGSRFIKVISAPDYEVYRMSSASKREFDAKGFRIR
jgi:hypothetical protein